jgi:hypothetical protein
MTKRSSGRFKRRKNDAYPTPLAPVLPLIPWLQQRGVRTFAEPCCGDGDLVRHLESHGLRCAYAGDITGWRDGRGRPVAGQDALATTDYGSIDAIITNPPWTRCLLHPLIRHFQQIAPTWLLFDSDWAHTKQARPYLRSCTDILPVGRVIWIAGTTRHGFDNAAWYRFDAHHSAGPVSHSFRSAPAPARTTVCAVCSRHYAARRSDSRTCSGTCRQRLRRQRLKCDIAVTASKRDITVTA